MMPEMDGIETDVMNRPAHVVGAAAARGCGRPHGAESHFISFHTRRVIFYKALLRLDLRRAYHAPP
jgi:hypothetical protein